MVRYGGAGDNLVVSKTSGDAWSMAVWANLGIALAMLGGVTEALLHFERERELDPADDEACGTC